MVGFNLSPPTHHCPPCIWTSTLTILRKCLSGFCWWELFWSSFTSFSLPLLTWLTTFSLYCHSWLKQHGFHGFPHSSGQSCLPSPKNVCAPQSPFYLGSSVFFFFFSLSFFFFFVISCSLLALTIISRQIMAKSVTFLMASLPKATWALLTAWYILQSW